MSVALNLKSDDVNRHSEYRQAVKIHQGDAFMVKQGSYINYRALDKQCTQSQPTWSPDQDILRRQMRDVPLQRVPAIKHLDKKNGSQNR